MRNPTSGDLCQKTSKPVEGNRVTIAMDCKIHGFVSIKEKTLKDGICVQCGKAMEKNPDVAKDPYQGWYRDIASQPVYIKDKQDLYNQCKKRGLAAAALMSGGVMKNPKKGKG